MLLKEVQLASKWTRIADGLIHSRSNDPLQAPGAPGVILVHGMVVSSRYMVPTAKLLGSLCRVFAIDLPGYGKSFKPPFILSIPELADVLALWMNALGIGRACFVGNSFGCQILVEFALRHQERVDRLVLQGPTVDRHARTYHQQAWRLLKDSPRERRSLGFLMLMDYRDAGFRRSVETFRLVVQDALEEKLPHVKAPALVVRGAGDPLVPQRWAEEVAGLLPHGELKVIPGAGHTVNYSHPLELVRVIRPFLKL